MAKGRIVLFVMVGLGLLLAAIALAAEPGSKDDPLATVTYVKRYSAFTRVELPAKQGLRLGQGAELVIPGLQGENYSVSEFDPSRDDLIDLSDGTLTVSRILLANHHYLNASSHDIFLKFEESLPVMVRGEWK